VIGTSARKSEGELADKLTVVFSLSLSLHVQRPLFNLTTIEQEARFSGWFSSLNCEGSEDKVESLPMSQPNSLLSLSFKPHAILYVLHNFPYNKNCQAGKS